jgi:xylose isomerase
MYANLKESVAGLCKHEQAAGGELYIAFEPKPNEGHPAMLIPTVASALLFWRKLEEEYGIPRKKKGVNKEFGHSEMVGLDHVYDTVEELDDEAMVHMHLNSQGYNDGIITVRPGQVRRRPRRSRQRHEHRDRRTDPGGRLLTLEGTRYANPRL